MKPVMADMTNAERVLARLKESGPQTCEQLYAALKIDWAELSLALDRLSRNGEIAAWRAKDRQDTIIGRPADGHAPSADDLPTES